MNSSLPPLGRGRKYIHLIMETPKNMAKGWMSGILSGFVDQNQWKKNKKSKKGQIFCDGDTKVWVLS